MIKKVTSYLLIIFPLTIFSQNNWDKAIGNIWISSSNDTLTFDDSSIHFLSTKIKYRIENEKIILIENEYTTNDLSQEDLNKFLALSYHSDSVVLKVKNLDEFLKKFLYGSNYGFYPYEIAPFSDHFKKEFDNKLVFYDSIRLNQYKKNLFEQIQINFLSATFKIDSTGDIIINSQGYNSLFKVNKGVYIGKLDSIKFMNLIEYLFNKNQFSLKQWNMPFQSSSSCSDCIPIKMSLKSKMIDLYFNSSQRENKILQHIISTIFLDNYPEDCDLKLKKEKGINHEVIQVDRDLLEEGVESVSGTLEFIEEYNGQYLYSLLIDSIYSQRNYSLGLIKHQKIYCISKMNLKSKENQNIGLVVYRKRKNNISIFYPLVRDKQLTYFKIIREFSTSKSIFFEFYGLYKPIGFSRGISPYGRSNRRTHKYRLFFHKDAERFNKLERKIYKLKNVAQH